MPLPQVSHNDVIEIFQWRIGNGHMFFGVVESEIMTDDEGDSCVYYKSVPHTSLVATEEDGLYHHHAVWDEEEQRWEDGDI